MRVLETRPEGAGTGQRRQTARHAPARGRTRRLAPAPTARGLRALLGHFVPLLRRGLVGPSPIRSTYVGVRVPGVLRGRSPLGGVPGHGSGVVVNLVDDIEHHREQGHAYHDAVVGLAEDRQVGVGVEIVVEFLGLGA